jgi:hypothetical protein
VLIRSTWTAWAAGSTSRDVDRTLPAMQAARFALYTPSAYAEAKASPLERERLEMCIDWDALHSPEPTVLEARFPADIIGPLCARSGRSRTISSSSRADA